MEITREALLERKAHAEKMRDDALGQANAWNGVANECDRWISLLGAEDGDSSPLASETEAIAPSGVDQSPIAESAED